jgi:hypothetical protein
MPATAAFMTARIRVENHHNEAAHAASVIQKLLVGAEKEALNKAIGSKKP